MAYRTLKAEFHAHEQAVAERLYRDRFASESTFRWEFLIGEYPAFCVLTTDFMLHIEGVLHRELDIVRTWNEIPRGASSGYIRTLLLREIEATNEIENVRSTRQEIDAALRAKLDDGGARKRFTELARVYNGLASGDLDLPHTLAEIRAVFDAITDGELAAEDEIEGDLFRAGPTRVVGATKIIHEAVPAREIEQRMTAVLEVMHSAEVPALVSAMVAHFMFEYIHPFYDGNGRTGRFLLAQQLQTVLSLPTAIALSPAISDNKNLYYKAFEQAEHPLNKGDLTPFVLTMLSLLSEAQEEMLRDLRARKLLFEDLSENIKQLPHQTRKEQRQAEILFVLGQVWLFDDMRIISQEELANHFSESKQTVRSAVQELEMQELVVAVTQRPLRFTLTDKACAELGLSK